MVNPADTKKGLDYSLLIPTLILTVISCACIFYFPETSNEVLTAIFRWGTGSFGWVFSLVTILCTLMTLWFIFGRYANMRLGDDPPERSTLAWLSLITAGSTTATILYWACVEFFYYVDVPPYGVEPFSTEAYTWASAYGPFHWGIVPYSQYSVMAVLIGFMLFVKKVDTVRISTACTTVIGEKNATGLLGKIFDITYLLTMLVSGAGLTLGLSTPLVGTLIAKIFDIEHTIAMDAGLILAWTLLFTITTYTGLQRGMTYVSVFKVILICVLMLFILLFGPTSFIILNSIETMGTLVQNIIPMATYTDVVGGSGFPQNWTMFYFAYFFTAIITSGLYFGRISRGRTVRQVALGVCLAGSLGSWVFFCVLGNYSIDVSLKDPETFTALMRENPYEAIFFVWNQMPLKQIVIPAFLLYAFIAVWAYMQGASYTLAMVCQIGMTGNDEPGKMNRVFWCVLTGVLALALLLIGGLQTVKNATILSAIPAVILGCIAGVGLMIDMNKYWGRPKTVEKDGPKVGSVARADNT